MLRNLYLCAVLMLAGTNAASACSPIDRDPTTEQQFAKASTVFVARIVRTEEVKMVFYGGTETIVEATFKAIEILKGRPPADEKVRSLIFGPSNCTIPLLAGWNYVIFLRQDNDANAVSWPAGSFPAPNLEDEGVKGQLEELRKLSAQAK